MDYPNIRGSACGLIAGIAGGLILAGGLFAGARDLRSLRQREGVRLAQQAATADEWQLDRWNVADGLKAERPFSFDDYCGAQCRPNSLYWGACVDACLDFGADNAEER